MLYDAQQNLFIFRLFESSVSETKCVMLQNFLVYNTLLMLRFSWTSESQKLPEMGCDVIDNRAISLIFERFALILRTVSV